MEQVGRPLTRDEMRVISGGDSKPDFSDVQSGFSTNAQIIEPKKSLIDQVIDIFLSSQCVC